MNSLFTKGYACIIGVGADLRKTVSDAQGIADIFQDSERCAYSPEHVQLLTGEKAKRDDILSALDDLAQKTDSESTVVIYFSGHGYKIDGGFGEFYYLMPFGYDQKKLPQTAISGAEFTQKLQAIPAKKLLVLLDCCHAGGLDAIETGEKSVFEKSPLPPEAQALFDQGKGRVLIASSRKDQKSYIYKGRPYSEFTLALIEALAGKSVAKKDGYIRVTDLALYASEVLPKRTRGKQNPILNFQEADNFILAYYAGGEAEPKGLPFDLDEEVELEEELDSTTSKKFADTQIAEKIINIDRVTGDNFHIGDVINNK